MFPEPSTSFPLIQSREFPDHCAVFLPLLVVITDKDKPLKQLYLFLARDRALKMVQINTSKILSAIALVPAVFDLVVKSDGIFLFCSNLK